VTTPATTALAETAYVPTGFAWRILGVFALLALVIGHKHGFSIDREMLPILPLIAVLVGVSVFYRTVRPNRMFSLTTGILAFFILNMLVMGPLSYFVLAYERPLYDAELAALDQALGFNWRWLQKITADSVWLSLLGEWIYGTSGLQMVLAWCVLGWSGQFQRLGIFMGALVLATGTVLVLSGLFPAVGAYVHYGIGPADLGHLEGTGAGVWHLNHFNALRDGSLRHLVLSKSEGLITFPSFHTVVAVLAGWGFWRCGAWRWPMAIYSGLVVLTTLPFGGHHLVDVLAGAAIAAAAVAIATRAEQSAPYAPTNSALFKAARSLLPVQKHATRS
jgi:membrane-associated phospholipid phosphatase